jgi:hypothetical protein
MSSIECHLELGGDDMNHWSAIGVHSRSLRADAAGRWVLGVAGAAKISSGPKEGCLHRPPAKNLPWICFVIHILDILNQVKTRYHYYLLPFSDPSRIRRKPSWHPESWVSDLSSHR